MKRFLLIARTGFNRGATWALTDTPLLIGRSVECDVHIDSMAVSRQQCRLYTKGNAVRFEDLGSRNPALIDGHPFLRGTLRSGDEFSIDKATFVVAITEELGGGSQNTPLDQNATSASLDTLTLFPDKDGNATWEGKSGDYDLLFRFTRGLSQCQEVGDLIAHIDTVLRERFSLDEVKLFRRVDNRWSMYSPRKAEAPKKIAAWCDFATREKRAYATRHAPDEAVASMLLSPLRSGDIEMGVCCIGLLADTESSNDDLLFFSTLCEIAGPFFHGLERTEELKRVNVRLAGYDSLVPPLVGTSHFMRAFRSKLIRVAATTMNVLITGDTGTGKEGAARAIHQQSDRAHGPYIIANCAAIPDALFESEFFGHSQGSFTGASENRKGLFELADGGTLFLDEVADLSASNQAKLLRVVEDGLVRPVGSEKNITTSVRIVSATNRKLEEVDFRRDLFYRLSTARLHITPLRERKSDIATLAQYFLDCLTSQLDPCPSSLDAGALKALQRHDWPGNARELRSVIEHAAHFTAHTQISEHDLRLEVQQDNDDLPELLPLRALEKQQIERALERSNNKIAGAARILEISRSTLYQKIAEYGIERLK